MAKIAPLPVDQRRGVQERIPLGGAGRIPTNVPALKIQHMDYSIGQANAQASQLIGQELGNMVGKVSDAVMFKIENDKQRDQLQINDDANNLQRQYKEQFSLARTASAQEEVADSYEKELAGFGERIHKKGWNKVEDRAWGQQLFSQLKGVSSEFRIKHSNSVYNENVSGLELKIGRYLKDARTSVNVDPILGMESGIRDTEKLFKIGAITKEQMFQRVKDFQDEYVNNRAYILAVSTAEKFRNRPSELPSQKELLGILQNGMKIPLTQGNIESAQRTFLKAYIQNVTEQNQVDKLEEISFEIKYGEANEKLVNGALLEMAQNKYTMKRHMELVAELEQKRDYKRAFQLKLAYEQKVKNKPPNPRVTNHWTSGIGYSDIERNPELFNMGVAKIDAIEQYIKSDVSEFRPETARDLDTIMTHFRTINRKMRTGLTDTRQVNGMISVAMNRITSGDTRRAINDKLQIPSTSAYALPTTFVSGFDTVKWSRDLLAYSPAYETLLNNAREIVAQKVREREGIYSDDRIKTEGMDTPEIEDDFATKHRAEVVNTFFKLMGMDYDKQPVLSKEEIIIKNKNLVDRANNAHDTGTIATDEERNDIKNLQDKKKKKESNKEKNTPSFSIELGDFEEEDDGRGTATGLTEKQVSSLPSGLQTAANVMDTTQSVRKNVQGWVDWWVKDTGKLLKKGQSFGVVPSKEMLDSLTTGAAELNSSVVNSVKTVLGMAAHKSSLMAEMSGAGEEWHGFRQTLGYPTFGFGDLRQSPVFGEKQKDVSEAKKPYSGLLPSSISTEPMEKSITPETLHKFRQFMGYPTFDLGNLRQSPIFGDKKHSRETKEFLRFAKTYFADKEELDDFLNFARNYSEEQENSVASEVLQETEEKLVEEMTTASKVFTIELGDFEEELEPEFVAALEKMKNEEALATKGVPPTSTIKDDPILPTTPDIMPRIIEEITPVIEQAVSEIAQTPDWAVPQHPKIDVREPRVEELSSLPPKEPFKKPETRVSHPAGEDTFRESLGERLDEQIETSIGLPDIKTLDDPEYQSLLENEYDVGQRSLGMIETLEPEFRSKLDKLVELAWRKHGLKVIFSEGVRSDEDQNTKYKEKKSNAEAGESPHQYSVGVDFAFKGAKGTGETFRDKGGYKKSSGDFALVGELAKQLGLVWGGDFTTPDRTHLEVANFLGSYISQMPDSFLDKKIKEYKKGGISKRLTQSEWNTIVLEMKRRNPKWKSPKEGEGEVNTPKSTVSDEDMLKPTTKL